MASPSWPEYALRTAPGDRGNPGIYISDSLHLYLHIPFCHRICPYCSFYKHTPGDTDLSAFIEALFTEARWRAEGLGLGPGELKTCYLGGGTPSMLSPTHLRRLFTGLREIYDFSGVEEITLEANPATFGRETADTYAQLGITRVSLGAQSFHRDHLRTLGREHQPADIEKSALLLKAAGIPSLNIDLMFSVPGQSLEDWGETLARALELAPQHLSAYNLTYEEDTPFFDNFRSGHFRDDEGLNADMFEHAHATLTAAGYRHYETSNYAQPGFESKHNRAYWAGADYLGLGPSAVSTIKRIRTKNVPDTARYIQQVSLVRHAESDVESLSDEQLNLERIALLLRTDEGVPVHYLRDIAPQKVRHLCSEGLAELSQDKLRLLGRGPLLVDAAVEYLVAECS